MSHSAKIRSESAWRRAVAWTLVSLLCACSAQGAELADAAVIPHLNDRGRAGYRQFLASTPHRAFAIAPGGGWGFSMDAASPDAARQEAVAACQEHTRQTCVPYAVDRKVVFDARQWPKLWGPYLNAKAAARAPVGVRRGERFPNLAFARPGSKPVKLSDFRGQVTVLHFWGSWCPPCQREMPDLVRLVASQKNDPAIRFVFLQIREDFASAEKWAAAHVAGRTQDLPLYDSGMTGSRDDSLRLADGGKMRDRDLAHVFPTTYVLDRRGITVFSHLGPVADWKQYAPFLRDAAARSGR